MPRNKSGGFILTSVDNSAQNKELPCPFMNTPAVTAAMSLKHLFAQAPSRNAPVAIQRRLTNCFQCLPPRALPPTHHHCHPAHAVRVRTRAERVRVASTEPQRKWLATELPKPFCRHLHHHFFWRALRHNMPRRHRAARSSQHDADNGQPLHRLQTLVQHEKAQQGSNRRLHAGHDAKCPRW